MKQPLYIFKSGTLRRQQNTLTYETTEEKRFLPIDQISDVYLFGETNLNTRVINFLLNKGITVHFFNYYGTYSGSLYPRERNISGLVVIGQCAHYLDTQKHLFLASQLVKGTLFNMAHVLRYYLNRGKENLQAHLQQIQKLLSEIPTITSIEELRGYEGKARKVYYSGWNEIISSPDFTLDKRTRRPPSNPVNALISFGNSLLYAVTTAELYHVHLHGAISFVHEPQSYRFSLALDIADLFKPVLVDRLIFSLVNKRQIKLSHFETQSNYAYLKESGRRVFVQKWQNQLETTISHPKLRRKVSYRHLIRLECYKLIKHFLGEQTYQPFKMWW